jgi:hypothetical protein
MLASCLRLFLSFCVLAAAVPTMALAQEVPTVVEAVMLESTTPISVDERSFGNNACRFVRKGAYRAPDGVIIRYAPSCSSFGAGETSLYTAQGKFPMIAVANATYKPSSLGSTYRFDKGTANLLIKFAVPASVSDAEINRSGMWRSLCVSFDCLIDSLSIGAIDQAKRESDKMAALEVIAQSSASKPSALATQAPTHISTQVYYDDGSLDAMDWYLGGLQRVAATRKDLRAEFLKYLSSRRTFDYSMKFSSPFDEEDFKNNLRAEYAGFVDRILTQSVKPLPSHLITFTPVKLEGYTKGKLKLSTCRDNGIYTNDGGMRCDGQGVIFPNNDVIGPMKALAALGPMASTGQIKPVRFASFFNGDDNGAPVFILNRGLPTSIEFDVPETLARAIFNVAKSTEIRPEYQSDYGGKMLTAKIAYGAPTLEDFGVSKDVQKGLIATFFGGAAVKYKTPARSICLFDGTGSKVLYCTDLK